MSYTADYGTAAEAMAGVSGDAGAKTGSAEVDGQKKPNGWFTAYRGDLAAAGVVQQGGHGGETAGPIVAALLKAGG
jgi:cell division protein FtsI/penicillin-binding protein 2